MTTPVDERPEPQHHIQNGPPQLSHPLNAEKFHEKSTDDEGTVVGEGSFRHNSPGRHRSVSHLTIPIEDHHSISSMDGIRGMTSPSAAREEAHRLDDDLQMLQVEQQVSNAAAAQDNDLRQSKSMHRSRSRREDVVDDFDVATNPLHQKKRVAGISSCLPMSLHFLLLLVKRLETMPIGHGKHLASI